jgi:hypothetical protein
VSDDYKIYVDGGQPATLNDGAGALTDCPTLQEAVVAWHKLPPEQKVRATVKVIGGTRRYGTPDRSASLWAKAVVIGAGSSSLCAGNDMKPFDAGYLT